MTDSSTIAATRMKFKLQPGVERGAFVYQDVAPALLHDSTYITALASSFENTTISGGTGAFPQGLELPVVAGASMTTVPVTGTIFWDTTTRMLVIYVGGSTGWIGITGYATTP